jgi:hypothetical protein
LDQGISKTLARSWVIEYDESYIISKVALARSQAASGKITSSATGFLKAAIEQDYQSALDIEKARQKTVDEARGQKRAREAELHDLKETLRNIEAMYRVQSTQAIEQKVQDLSEEERREVHEAFEATLSSRLFVTEFRKHGGGARASFPDALKFWQDRGAGLPSFDAFAETQTTKKPDDMRARIAELEGYLK